MSKENETWYPDAINAFEKGDYKTCQNLYHKYVAKSSGHYIKKHNLSVVPWFESAIALGDWDDAVDAFTKWSSLPGAFYNGRTIDGEKYWLTAEGLRTWASENAPIHNEVWRSMVHFYWNKLSLFDRSPFVKHMGKLGKATIEQERMILGNALNYIATQILGTQNSFYPLTINNAMELLNNSCELGCVI